MSALGNGSKMHTAIIHQPSLRVSLQPKGSKKAKRCEVGESIFLWMLCWTICTYTLLICDLHLAERWPDPTPEINLDKPSESTVSQLAGIMWLPALHLNHVKVKLPNRVTVWECLDMSAHTHKHTHTTNKACCFHTYTLNKKWLNQCKMGMHMLGVLDDS